MLVLLQMATAKQRLLEIDARVARAEAQLTAAKAQGEGSAGHKARP